MPFVGLLQAFSSFVILLPSLVGNYYLETKNGDKALEFASKVLKKNHLDFDGLILRGETYILMRK